MLLGLGEVLSDFGFLGFVVLDFALGFGTEVFDLVGSVGEGCLNAGFVGIEVFFGHLTLLCYLFCGEILAAGGTDAIRVGEIERATEVESPILTDFLCILLALGEGFTAAFYKFVEGRQGGFDVTLGSNEGVELLAGCIDGTVVFVLTEAKKFALLYLYLLHVGADEVDFLSDFVAEHVAAIAGLDCDNLLADAINLSDIEVSLSLEY